MPRISARACNLYVAHPSSHHCIIPCVLDVIRMCYTNRRILSRCAVGCLFGMRRFRQPGPPASQASGPGAVVACANMLPVCAQYLFVQRRFARCLVRARTSHSYCCSDQRGRTSFSRCGFDSATARFTHAAVVESVGVHRANFDWQTNTSALDRS